jgi:hypothetical protein
MAEQSPQNQPTQPAQRPPYGSPAESPGSARWLIVILLTVIATCLLIEVGLTTSSARAEPADTGGTPTTFAVAGKVTPETYGLYLVNLKQGTICVYQYLPASHKLRLMAARTFVFDRELEDFNNEKPTPREVKKLIEEQRSLQDTKAKTGS